MQNVNSYLLCLSDLLDVYVLSKERTWEPCFFCLVCFIKRHQPLPNSGATPADKDDGGQLYHFNKSRAKSSLPVEYLSTLCTPSRDSAQGRTWQRPSINIGVLRFYCVTHNSLVLLPQNQSKDRRNLHTMSNSSFVQMMKCIQGVRKTSINPLLSIGQYVCLVNSCCAKAT